MWASWELCRSVLPWQAICCHESSVERLSYRRVGSRIWSAASSSNEHFKAWQGGRLDEGQDTRRGEERPTSFSIRPEMVLSLPRDQERLLWWVVTGCLQPQGPGLVQVWYEDWNSQGIFASSGYTRRVASACRLATDWGKTGSKPLPQNCKHLMGCLSSQKGFVWAVTSQRLGKAVERTFVSSKSMAAARPSLHLQTSVCSVDPRTTWHGDQAILGFFLSIASYCATNQTLPQPAKHCFVFFSFRFIWT